jgi:hypothetical protein
LEWVYIFNLDSNELEVYTGGNWGKKKGKKTVPSYPFGRYATLKLDDPDYDIYGVYQVCSFKLSEMPLPDDFASIVRIAVDDIEMGRIRLDKPSKTVLPYIGLTQMQNKSKMIAFKTVVDPKLK